MKDHSVINRFELIASSACVFIASSLAFAEVPPIEKIAPENSVLIAGAKNTAQAMENIKKTGLWAMWQSEKMKTLRADAMKQMDEDIKKMMQELGVEEDSLTYPTGAAGLSMFTVTDPDLGTPEMAMLVYADYGDAAEKTDKLIRAALDKGVKEGKLEFEAKDVAGREVLAIDLSKMQPAEEPDAGGDMGLPIPDPSEVLKGLTRFNYVRDGGTLLVSSDLTALTDALDAIDGKGDGGKYAGREDFQNTLSQISGGAGENDAYAVVLTRDVMDMLGENGQMMMMFRPTLRTLTGEVAGYAAGLRFDTGTAMIEQSLGIYMPNGKKGLSELMDKPAARGDIPAFVGADSTGYMTANFDFSGVMAMVKSVINSNPMLAAQGQEALDQIEPMATPILNALGGKIISATGKDSSVTAIECKDSQGFENAFAGLAAQGGLESRDFLGQRIYTMKEGMAAMMPMGGGEAEPLSIGIGGGFVFIGSTPSVEQSLRSTSNADAPTLAKDEAFQKAVGVLSKDPIVAWGYTDTVASIDAMLKSRQEALKAAIEQVKEFDPDMAKEMETELTDMAKMTGQIDEAFLREFVGPAVWQVRSTDTGFIMNGYVLPAK